MKRYFCAFTVALLVMLCSCGKNEGVTFPSSQKDSVQPESSTLVTSSPEITQITEKINKSTVIDTENETTAYPVDYESLVLKGKKGEGSLTMYSPLPPVSYKASSPERENLSDEKKGHSHGPASGGKPHHTVIDFQKSFDPFSAVTLDLKSKEKVLYLTFDCGYEYENLTARVLDVLKEKKVPAAFFCTLDHISKEKEIISRMINEGHIVGNHSATHASFAQISREQMAKELESTENYLRENYGYSSKFFRFPEGVYTENALDLVAGLGYVSVFWSVAYNDWNVNDVKGKDYAVETVMSRLHDGAIILLHSVSKDNADALGEIIDKARQQGYVFRALTELGR